MRVALYGSHSFWRCSLFTSNKNYYYFFSLLEPFKNHLCIPTHIALGYTSFNFWSLIGNISTKIFYEKMVKSFFSSIGWSLWLRLCLRGLESFNLWTFLDTTPYRPFFTLHFNLRLLFLPFLILNVHGQIRNENTCNGVSTFKQGQG